jgi:hypothetical protein
MRANLKNVEFYETWMKKDWIVSMIKIPIGPEYDAHQWKESVDPWTHTMREDSVSAKGWVAPKS